MGKIEPCIQTDIIIRKTDLVVSVYIKVGGFIRLQACVMNFGCGATFLYTLDSNFRLEIVSVYG